MVTLPATNSWPLRIGGKGDDPASFVGILAYFQGLSAKSKGS